MVEFQQEFWHGFQNDTSTSLDFLRWFSPWYIHSWGIFWGVAIQHGVLRYSDFICVPAWGKLRGFTPGFGFPTGFSSEVFHPGIQVPSHHFLAFSGIGYHWKQRSKVPIFGIWSSKIRKRCMFGASFIHFSIATWVKLPEGHRSSSAKRQATTSSLGLMAMMTVDWPTPGQHTSSERVPGPGTKRPPSGDEGGTDKGWEKHRTTTLKSIDVW